MIGQLCGSKNISYESKSWANVYSFSYSWSRSWSGSGRRSWYEIWSKSWYSHSWSKNI